MRVLLALFLSAVSALAVAPTAGAKGFVADIPVKRAPANVWAVGDADTTPGGFSLAALIARDPRIDRFLYLGDVYSTGTAQQFATRYTPLYGALRPVTAPVAGNHEWANRATGYYPYWTAARGSSTPDYYRFMIGRWQVLALNSEIGTSVDSPQARWVAGVLRRSRKAGNCRIVLTHKPRYSVSDHGDQSALEPIWQLLRGKARLWLSGHEHNTQQFAPVGGITQIVAGAGGRKLYKSIRASQGALQWTDTTHFSALHMSIRGSRARWSVVASDGSTLRSGISKCRYPKRNRIPRSASSAQVQPHLR